MKDEAIPVIPFGKTAYDSSILDDIYRTWGTLDGGTCLSAYYDGELRLFKVDVPYSIIKTLLENRDIGSLCYNYDWKEMDNFELKQEIKNHPEQLYKQSKDAGDVALDKLMQEFAKSPWKKYYSREYCLELVRNIPVTCLQEMFDNADKVREWLEGDL